MGIPTKDSKPLPAKQEPAVAMAPSLISSIANTVGFNYVAAPPHGVPLSDICKSEKCSLSSSTNEGVDKENLDQNGVLVLPVAQPSIRATNDDWENNAATMRRRPLRRLSRKRKSQLHWSLGDRKKGNEIITTIDSETNKENSGKDHLATPPPPPKRKIKGGENSELRHTIFQTEEDELVREIILALPPYKFVQWGTSRGKLLPPLPHELSETRMKFPKPNAINNKPSRLTLVLDLDETLVHSSMVSGFHDPPDTTIKLNVQGTDLSIYMQKRPEVDLFLASVSELYEVVVFTASEKLYADQAINMLDPSGKLIQHRLYRESCIMVKGNYLKDLSALGRDISRTVIVDNNPAAFGYHLDNGVPISSWFSDTEDCSLQALIPLLESLSAAEDVRPIIRCMFNLKDTVYWLNKE